MERFRNILFASLGGKDDFAALDRANRLAIANNASLTLVRVVEDPPLAMSYFLSKKHLAEFTETTVSQAQGELDELVKKTDSSLHAKTKVLIGKSFIELIRSVIGNSHDLLVKAKHPSSTENSLDSTDLHLLRKCPCPVWIIKPNQRKPFGKILIAVDPDPSDPSRLSLHADLLKIGTSLAQRENGKIEVVHAWQLEGESILRSSRFKFGDEEIEKITSEVLMTRQKWLEDLLAPYIEMGVKGTFVKGLSGPTLVNVIEKKKPDIVVMGTLARSGLPGLLIGNTAEFVLSKISCSILTIKPKGFKTPIA